MMMRQRKREGILNSVLRLVNQEGFYHLSMKKIADEARIAAGTIYLYFTGKEDLINALYKMIAAEFNTLVLAAFRPERALHENFEAMMHAALVYYLDNPDRFSFMEQYTYAPFICEENKEVKFLLLMPIYKMIRSGKERQIIKDLPDAYLLAMIYGPLNSIIKLHLAGKTDLNQLGAKRKFYQAVWNAITIDQ